MIKKIVLACLLIFYLLLLTGCHTVHGVGQDIESAGEAIERASDKK